MITTLKYAPSFKLIRTLKVDDVVGSELKSHGVNCTEFDEVLVMLSLHNLATAADLQLHFWSDAIGGFVAEAVPVVASVTAAGVLVRLTTHRHNSVFFEITGIAGGIPADDRVKIEVAGVPKFNEVG